MPNESSKKIAVKTDLSQLVEGIEMLRSSLAALTDSIEDLYLQSDMPGALHLKDVTLDLISKIKR